jgi:hypothetical protein
MCKRFAIISDQASFFGQYRSTNMFIFKIKILFTAMFLFLLGASAASAQFADGSVLKVKIPVSFVVREKTFPAGEYVFARPSNVSTPHFLTLRGEDGKQVIFSTMAENLVNAAPSTQLTFNVIDGNYFLSTIRVESDITTYELAKTKLERTLSEENKPITRLVLSGAEH